MNQVVGELLCKLDDGAYLPERAHDMDAGYDLRTPYSFTIWDSYTIDTGVHIAIPKGYAGLLKSKSGLYVRDGITGEGLIDAGYTGSIVVRLDRRGEGYQHFERGDKIIQLVIVPVLVRPLRQVDVLPATERGSRGFGSSGR